MKQKYVLTLVGLGLIALGLVGRGWMSLAIWLGGDFLALGIAHALGAHGLYGKRPDGSIPFWSWLVFLPLLLLYTAAVWHLIRLLRREPALNWVTERLAVGRRLLGSELQQGFDNYVDLTAEFPEPASIRHSPAYINFPILDGDAPSPDALAEAIDRLRPGKTYVHCAAGHGRAGLFALALLLKSGEARDIGHGLVLLRTARPGINLNRTQRACIEAFARAIVTAPTPGRDGVVPVFRAPRALPRNCE